MNNIDLSIIVTCYNFQNYIADAINSLLVATENINAEIIIVDDCSSDNSPNIIKSFTSDKIVFIQHEVNCGPRKSINEAFTISKGKYICRFDGDDLWHKDFFNETIQILEKYEEVGLVYTDISIINTYNEITSLSGNITRSSKLANPGFEFIDIFKKYYIAAPSIIARREAWQIGFPVPAPYDALDWYLSLKMSLNWKFYFLNKPLASYRVHSTNMHTSQIFNKKEEVVTLALFEDILDKSGLTKKLVNNLKSSSILVLAEKYFGMGMYDDAKRCYLSAIKYDFSALSLNHIKHLLGTFVGKKIYNYIKK